MRTLGALLASFALACSSSNPSTTDGGLDGGADAPSDAVADGPRNGGPDYVSGSRLRAEVWASADGAKQWHGWYDSQLKTECRVEAASDGVSRCVPTGMSYDEGTFSDNGCKQPVASIESCEPVPTYIHRFPTTGCNATVYAVGAKLGALGTVWTNNGGGCNPTTPSTTTDFYAVGAQVDPTTFVKETLAREDRGPQLKMQFEVGDDGSKQPGRLYDTNLKGSCMTLDAPAMPYTDRCVPINVGYAEGDYADTSCKQPAITVVPDYSCVYPSDDVATIAWVYDPVQCGGYSLDRFVQIGAKSSGPLNRLNGTLCQNDPNAPATWYASGGDVAATSFPAISYSQSGQGRIVRNWQTAASKDQLFVDGFYDTQLSIACDQLPATDGKLRCIPHLPEQFVYYTDDKCTSAVVPVTSSSSSCPKTPPPAKFRVQRPTYLTCGSTSYRAEYQIGAKVATPAAVWSMNGTCQPGVVDATADYYAASEVAPTTFAELLDVTE